MLDCKRPVTLTDYRNLGRKLTKIPATECKAIAERRSILKPKSNPTVSQFIRMGHIERNKVNKPLKSRLFPISGSKSDNVCYDKKKKNYNSVKATFNPSNLEVHNEGRYSSKCTYTKYTYTQKVESWGKVVSDKWLFYRIHTNKGIKNGLLKAPKGWSWQLDSNGIYLGMGKLNYRPSSDDILSGNLRTMQNAARNNYKVMRQLLLEQRKAEKTRKAELKVFNQKSRHVMVCLTDALKAGNCLTGVSNWANQNKLDPKKHYPLVKILSLPQDENVGRRLKAVGWLAIKRYEREMEQGYSELSYHTQSA